MARRPELIQLRRLTKHAEAIEELILTIAREYDDDGIRQLAAIILDADSDIKLTVQNLGRVFGLKALRKKISDNT